jgi:hypothetical protein
MRKSFRVAQREREARVTGMTVKNTSARQPQHSALSQRDGKAKASPSICARKQNVFSHQESEELWRKNLMRG